jgi:hypothetical protein
MTAAAERHSTNDSSAAAAGGDDEGLFRLAGASIAVALGVSSALRALSSAGYNWRMVSE